MNIFLRIEYLVYIGGCLADYILEVNPISRRLFAMGLVSQMHLIAESLSEIDKRIDTSLSEDDALLSIKVLDRLNEINKLLDEKLYEDDSSKEGSINRMTDFFPLDKKDYSFSSEKAEVMKTGLRYLCSDANIAPRDLVFSLNKGLTNIAKLLISINQKKHHIENYQYEDFWYSFLCRDDDLIPEKVYNDYEKWKEYHDYEDFQVLKDKRTQEILKLLKSGVFNYDTVPVKREIDKSIIKISEDSLEDGTDMPDKIDVECARLSAYVTMKDDIICLDYAKLGKYVYRNYRSFHDEVSDSLIYFDYMLILIHHDMAECKPKLKKYLRFYEDEENENALNDAYEIINSCKKLISDKTPNDFLKLYLKDAFNGDCKIEVQAKLKNQSRYTLICEMLGMLKTTLKVFKPDTTSKDLAKELSSVIERPKQDSLKRYIDEGASDHVSKLSNWTTLYVMKELGTEEERAFVKIAGKRDKRTILE